MTTSFAAIIASKKRRHIIRNFKKAGAILPNNAKPLLDLGLAESLIFKIQKMRGVIVEIKPNLFYLDEVREEKVARTRLLLVFLLLIIAVLLWLYVFI